MKNKLLYMLLATVCVFSACEKSYLNTKPTDQSSDQDVYATTDNLKVLLNGVHRYMYSSFGNQDQAGQGGMMINMDVMGEDLIFPTAGNGWYIGTASWVSHRNVNSSLTSFAYRFYYRIIGNVNLIIANVDKVNGTETAKAELKGQAYAYRAWAYFQLVQLFGKRYDAAKKPNNQLGVPLAINPEDIQLPRATVEEVYTQINTDLEASIKELSMQGVNVTNKSNLSLAAVYGIKARVALTMQNYPDAQRYAALTLSSNKYSLMSDAEYQSGFSNNSVPEWIWGMHQQDDQQTYFTSFFAYMSWNFNSTNIRQAPKCINSAIYEKLTNTDVRKKLWEPNPTVANFPLPATNYSRKPYMNRKFMASSNSSSVGDVCYMRSSEMLLIQAEAYAMQNDWSNAQKALFNLANKRDPNYVISTKVGKELIDEILWQRRVELWGEGFRFLDLKRLNQDLDRSLAPNFNATFMANLVKVPAGDRQWQFLIPQAELNANSAVRDFQNE